MEKQDFNKIKTALIDLEDGNLENIRFSNESLIFVLANNRDRKVYDFNLVHEGKNLLEEYNLVYGCNILEIYKGIKDNLVMIDDDISHNKKIRNFSICSMVAVAGLAVGHVLMADNVMPVAAYAVSATVSGCNAFSSNSKKEEYEKVKIFSDNLYKKTITDLLSFVAVESCELDNDNLDFIITMKSTLEQNVNESKTKIKIKV